VFTYLKKMPAIKKHLIQKKLNEEGSELSANAPLVRVEDDMEIDVSDDDAPEAGVPVYAAAAALREAGGVVKKSSEIRRIVVPAHRLTPLRESWNVLLQPLIMHLKLQVRMNTKRKAVEIRASEETTEQNAVQKASEYMRAFLLGFSVEDAVALLRLDDLFIESFEVKDVKKLTNDHLGRGIGRVVGKNGQTKYAIENATRTRIVVSNDRVHILGSFTNIRFARNAICDLILGSPATKVYGKLNIVGKRIAEKM
jgi:RNA-binding protein PNO1